MVTVMVTSEVSFEVSVEVGPEKFWNSESVNLRFLGNIAPHVRSACRDR